MALSRRGILFSPSMKEKRIENYFKWPASMRAEESENNDKKKSVVDEIVRIGKIVVKYTAKVVNEFLFPKAQINFFPRDYEEQDSNASYIFPFFENLNRLTTHVLGQKKSAPGELIFVKQKKNRRSNWCQTDSVLFEDIEKSPYFSFKIEEVKGIWLKEDGKKDKLGEGIENKSTDCESAEFELKNVERKVIRRVNRRSLGIVQCENLSIVRSFKSVTACSENDQCMIIENDYCSIQIPPNQEPFLTTNIEPVPDPNDKTKKKSSLFPIIPPQITYNPQETTESIPNCKNFQLNPSEQPQKVDLNPKIFQPSLPEPNHFQSNSENSIKHPENNPFLNLNTIKKTEPCFIFGSSASTPPTIQKNLFGPAKFPDNPQSPNLMDVEMTSVLPQTLPLSSQNQPIQTPNLNTSCLFTQNNISDLYNKTPNHFPVLNSGNQLFTLPSHMTPSMKPTSLFGIPSPKIPSSASSAHFNLGQIASTSKKK